MLLGLYALRLAFVALALGDQLSETPQTTFQVESSSPGVLNHDNSTAPFIFNSLSGLLMQWLAGLHKS